MLLVALLFTAGCQTTYYAVWEKMGKEKRHLLKDNLNAQAVSSLKNEVSDIEMEVSSLIADMNRSIKAADEFVKSM